MHPTVNTILEREPNSRRYVGCGNEKISIDLLCLSAAWSANFGALLAWEADSCATSGVPSSQACLEQWKPQGDWEDCHQKIFVAVLRLFHLILGHTVASSLTKIFVRYEVSVPSQNFSRCWEIFRTTRLTHLCVVVSDSVLMYSSKIRVFYSGEKRILTAILISSYWIKETSSERTEGIIASQK